MSEHIAKIQWKRDTPDFTYEGYDRTHTITFNGGLSVKGSSAPAFNGKAHLVNPEEMLAAAVSSCHMLTFLAVAAKSRLVVDLYEDKAVAHLEKDPQTGKMKVTKVDLNPHVAFSSPVEGKVLQDMHSKAHHNCFIANTVNCEVKVSPV